MTNQNTELVEHHLSSAFSACMYVLFGSFGTFIGMVWVATAAALAGNMRLTFVGAFIAVVTLLIGGVVFAILHVLDVLSIQLQVDEDGEVAYEDEGR